MPSFSTKMVGPTRHTADGVSRRPVGPLRLLRTLALVALFVLPMGIWIPTAAAQGQGTLTISSNVVGDTAEYVFSFPTQGKVLAGNGAIKLTFPNAGGMPYGLTGLTAVLTGANLAGAARTETISPGPPNGNELTITRSSPSAEPWTGLITIRLQNVVNPLWSGTTGVVSQAVTYVDGNSLGFYPALAFAKSPLTTPQVASELSVVGQASLHTFSFGTTKPLPEDAGVRVTFPLDYSDPASAIAGTPTLSGTPAGFCGTPAITKSVSNGAIAVLLTQSGGTCPAPTQISFSLTGINNPGRSVSSGKFLLEMVTPAGAAYADATAIRGPLLPLSDYFAQHSAEGADTKAGATSTHTITFKTDVVWPTTGQLAVYLPPTSLTVPAFQDAIGSATLAGPGCAGAFDAANIRRIDGESRRVVLLPRTAAQMSCAAGTLTVTLSSIKNPTLPNTYTLASDGYTFAIQDGQGRDLQASPAPSVFEITTGLTTGFSISWTATQKALDKEVTLSFPFNLANPWPANGYATIDFPPGFSLEAINTVTTPGAGGETACAAGYSAVVSNLKVRINRVAASGVQPTQCPAGAHRFVLADAGAGGSSGITLPPKAGFTKPFLLSFYTADGFLIEQSVPTISSTPVAPQLTSPALTVPGAFVSASSFAAGDDATYTFSFGRLGETGSAWKSTDLLAVGFPSGYDLSGVGTTFKVTGPCTSNEGLSLTAKEIVDNIIVLKRPNTASDCQNNAVHAVEVRHVKNPLALGPTGSFYAATRSAGGVDQRAYGNGYTATPVVNIVAAVIPNVEFRPASLTAGANTVVTVEFTSMLALPADSSFGFGFPAGFILTNPAIQGGFTGCDGGLSASLHTPLIVSVTRTQSPTVCPPGEKSIRFSGVKNPSAVGPTGAFSVTMLAAGAEFAKNASVAPIRILPTIGQLSFPDVNIQGGKDYAGATDAAYLLQFESSHGIPQGGRVRVEIPPELGIANLALGTQSRPESCNVPFELVISEGSAFLDNDAPGCGPGDYSFQLLHIDNPPVAMESISFIVVTENAAGLALEESAPIPVEIVPGPLNVVAILADNPVAYGTGTYRFRFNQFLSWPADGQIFVRFPDGFDLTDLTAQQMTGCATGFEAPELTDDELGVLLTRDGGGGTCLGATDVSVIISGVGNPGSTRPATFDLELQRADGEVLSAAYDVPGPLIEPSEGYLEDTTVEVANYEAGATTPLWANFTTVGDWPPNGRLVVTFPSGFGIGNAQFGALSGCQGTYTRVIDAQQNTITILRGGAADECAGSLKSLRINGLKNPTVSGVTPPFSLMVKDGVGGDLNADHAATLSVLPGDLDVDEITAESDTASALTNYEIQLSPANPWPANGKLVVQFSPGFDLSDVDEAIVVIGGSVRTLGITTGMSGQNPVLTLTRSGGFTTFSTAHVFIAGIRNPPQTGPTTDFVISTTTSLGQVIDRHDDAGVTITPKGFVLDAPIIVATNNVAGKPSQYALTFTPRSALPATGCFRVLFPDGFDANPLSITASIARDGTPSTVDVNVITSLPGITLARTAGGSSLQPSTTTITLQGITNPNFSGSVGPITVLTLESQGPGADCTGADLDGAYGGIIALVPAPFSASISQISHDSVGAEADYTFELLGAPDWTDGDVLALLPPPGFSLDEVLGVAASPDSAAETLLVSVDDGSILVEREALHPWTAHPKIVRVLGIGNPPAASAAYVFQAELRDADGRIRAFDPIVEVPEIIGSGGALSGLEAEADSQFISDETSYAFDARTISDWAEDAGLRLRFPASFDTSDVSSDVESSPASLGTFAADVLDDGTIMLSRNGPAIDGPITFSFTVDGVRNPPVGGSPGPISLATLDEDGLDVDVGLVPAPPILGNSLTASVTSSTGLAGELDTYSLSLGTADPWPGHGVLTIEFPDGYGLEQLGDVTLVGCDDSVASLTVVDQTLTLERGGDDVCAAGPGKGVVVHEVRNPLDAGPPGPFRVTMLDDADNTIGASPEFAGPEILAFLGLLADTKFQPTASAAATAGSAAGSYLVEFTGGSEIPASGFISIRFPEGFDASAATIPASAMSTCTTLEDVASPPDEVLRRLSTSCGPGVLRSFTVSMVRNPPTAGATGPIIVSTKDATGRDLESAAFFVDVTSGSITLHTPSRISGSPVVGETATYSLGFIPTNPIPADGRIIISVPLGSDLMSASVPFWQGCNVPIESVTKGTSSLTVALGGSPADPPCSSGTLKTVRVQAMRNSGRSSAGPTWAIQTQRIDGTTIDQSAPVAGPALVARGGGLSGVALDLDDALVGARTSVLLGFTTSTAWDAAGKFAIEAPSGFSWNAPSATRTGATPCDGDFTAALDPLENRRLILTRTNADPCAPGHHDILVQGLVNGPSTGTSAPFLVATQTAQGYDIDASSSPTVLLSPAMSPASLVVANPVAGATSTYNFTFDSKEWPKDGYLFVHFPLGSGLSATSLNASAPCAGSKIEKATLPGLPASVIAVKLLDGSCAPATRTIRFNGTVNALNSGARPAGLRLTGTLANGLPVLSGTEAITALLEPNAFTAKSLLVSPSSALHVAEFKFTFTTPLPLTPGSSVHALIPSAYGLSGTITARNGASDSPAFIVEKETGTIDAALQGSTAWVAGPREFVLSGILNPIEAGVAPNLTLQFVSADGFPYVVGEFQGPTLTEAGDVSKPTVPGALTSASTAKESPAWSKGLVHTIVWAAATDPGGSVAGYSFALNADPDAVSNTTTASAQVTFPSEGTHEFRVRAIDAAGNPGDIRTFIVKLDNVAPVLGALTADRGVDECATTATASVSWPAATDARSGVHGTAPYRVAVGTATGTAALGQSATVTLAKGVNNVSVTAQDAAGNTAVRYIELKRDVDAPEVTIVAPKYARAPFEIKWEGADDCAGIKDYRIESKVGQNSVFAALYEGLNNKTIVAAPTSDGIVYFRGRATDKLDHVGLFATQNLVSTIFDATAPAAPTNAEATPLARSEVRITWLPSTDAGGSGLDGYNVYRADTAGAPFTKITTKLVSDPTFTDTAPNKENGRAYFYQVAAVDAAGNEGPRSLTTSAVADNRVLVAASRGAIDTIAQALELVSFSSPLKAVDTNQDGRYDGFDDPTGTIVLEEATAVGERQALLLRAVYSGTLALWVPATNDVMPVQKAPATIVDEEDTEDGTIVTIKVYKASGWILINATDARPDLDLVGVMTADGRAIPLHQVFREDGFVRVLDDPDVTYKLMYATSATTLENPNGGPMPTWIWLAIASISLVAFAVGGTVMVRRRRDREMEAAMVGTPEDAAAAVPEGQATAGDATSVPDAASSMVETDGAEPTLEAEAEEASSAYQAAFADEDMALPSPQQSPVVAEATSEPEPLDAAMKRLEALARLREIQYQGMKLRRETRPVTPRRQNGVRKRSPASTKKAAKRSR